MEGGSNLRVCYATLEVAQRAGDARRGSVGGGGNDGGDVVYLAYLVGFGGNPFKGQAIIWRFVRLDIVHPPAVATSLSFALGTGDESDVVIFGFAVAVMTLLVILERDTLWLLAYYQCSKTSWLFPA